MQWNWRGMGVRWKELWERYRYVLLVVLAGVILLLLPGGGTSRPEQSRQPEESFDLAAVEDKLEQALSEIQGAGEVTVVLTLKEGGRRVLARDTEVSDRAQRNTAVVISQGGGGQQTVPVQEIYPTYQGALVVCTGGGDAAIKLALTEAVRALTGLSAEKISICKRQ